MGNYKTSLDYCRKLHAQRKLIGGAAKQAMIELVGDQQLAYAFQHMKVASARKIMKPAVNRALTIANREAKSIVPKRSGHLRKAIGKGGKVYKEQYSGWLTVRKGHDYVENGKTKDPSRYAWPVEYRNAGRQSFLRKALANKRAQVDAMIRMVAREKLVTEAAKARAKGRTL